jgi:aminoglycoside phosphotransferase (APT) family kinase protein
VSGPPDLIAERTRAALRGALARTADEAVALGDALPAPPLPTEKELTEFLRRDYPDAVASGLELMPGLTSKEISTFQLTGVDTEPIPCILRRDRPFSSVDTSASGEFGLLRHLADHGLPVARVLGVSTSSDRPFHAPALIMQRAAGAANPLAALGDGAADVIRQEAELLGRIHSVPLDGLEVPIPRAGADTRARVREMIESFRDVLVRDRMEPQPQLEAGYEWLLANLDDRVDDAATLVHADYDLRNILTDGGKITAVLDWELAHVGHPAEDLGYCRAEARQALPWDEFRSLYTAAADVDVDEAAVDFFEIWGITFRATTLVTAARGFADGRLDDIIIATALFIEFPVILKQLDATLAAV